MDAITEVGSVTLFAWAMVAKPNDRYTYLVAASTHVGVAKLKQAREAWEIHTKGLVTLVQKKTAPGMYEFLAVKVSNRAWELLHGGPPAIVYPLPGDKIHMHY